MNNSDLFSITLAYTHAATHRNDSAKEKVEWKKWLDIESLSGFLCLRYCRSLNGKIFASAFGGHLYRELCSSF